MKRHVFVALEHLIDDCVPAYVRERMKLPAGTHVRVLAQSLQDKACNRLMCEFDRWQEPPHLDPYEGG